jgi:myo-inositol-1(or 4)-monophosphatase
MPLDPLLLSTAIEIALRAGEMQMASFGRDDLRVDKKGRIDLVTEVDVAVEQMCRDMLRARFPYHRILAEELPDGGALGPIDAAEDPAARADGARHCWVLDPIDGTSNYAHGLPIFSVSLGLEIDGVVEIGVVYDPTRRELYTAERGQGAFLNGQRLRASTPAELIDSLLLTGFPYAVEEKADEIVGLFGAFVKQARAVRRLGSAALDLCYVAAGRVEGFWEQGLKPWDIAAGSLIVEEAGGVVTGCDGQTFSTRKGHILASNGRIQSAMLEVIRKHAAERSGSRTT